MKKLYYGAFALVLGVALTFAVSAFTSADKKNVTDVYWQFDSQDIDDAKTSSHYTMVNISSLPSCDNAKVLPCVLKVSEAIDDRTELQSYLNTFADEQAVVTSAYGTKSE